MENKRHASVLIPYKIFGGEISVFLQKRTADAPHLPGYFAFFGGGMESGETPEETLMREIKEELVYDLRGHKFLGRYEFEKVVLFVFVLRVKNDFESKIEVREGDGGKFFTQEEINSEPKMIDWDREILGEFFHKFHGK